VTGTASNIFYKVLNRRHQSADASPSFASQAGAGGWFALLTNGLSQIDGLPEESSSQDPVSLILRPRDRPLAETPPPKLDDRELAAATGSLEKTREIPSISPATA